MTEDLKTHSYVPYSPAVEKPADDETETFQKIAETMSKAAENSRQHNNGHAVRVSHAKAHGLLKGILTVEPNLPPELRQGLFATESSYEVIVRLAQVPGECLDDRKVSSPRGMALKILGVTGPKIAGDTTGVQDFVLDTGLAFNADGPKEFLAQFKPNTNAPSLPEGVKGAVSTLSRATNAVLGGSSKVLDFFGHNMVHPMSESYYSQTPIRYGQYIAKVGVTPASHVMTALLDMDYTPGDENGLRTSTVEFFRTNDAEFFLSVQLNTDLDKMPIEDAGVVWDEDASPYHVVARLRLPVQTAYDHTRAEFIDEHLSFSPAHCLEEFRPLGGINRARLFVYGILAKQRFAANAKTEVPSPTAHEVPA